MPLERLLRPDISYAAMLHRLMDAVMIVMSLILVSLLSDYPFFEQPWTPLYSFAAASAMGCFWLFAEFNGVYHAWRGMSQWQGLLRIVLAWLGVMMGLLLLAFVTQTSANFPRSVFLGWFIAAPLALFAWRSGHHLILISLPDSGRNARSVAIFGAGQLGQRLARTMVASPWMGLRPVAFFDDHQNVGFRPMDNSDLRVVGGKESFIQWARAASVDVVYIALPARYEERAQALLNELGDCCVSVYVVPDLFTYGLLQTRWESVGGYLTMSIIENPCSGIDAWFKRITDVVLSSAALMVLALPMVCIALGIKRAFPGQSIIFKQHRYGLDGREIVMWKFRTMTVSEDGPDLVQAIQGDERVTGFGAFLRRTSLDELPQFVNVLRGHMSIVGPRPHPVALNEQHRGLIGGYMLRHKVKPGITGLAQVNGSRGETETMDKMAKRIQYDIEYIRRWNLWLDIRIMVRTLFVGFNDKNAY